MNLKKYFVIIIAVSVLINVTGCSSTVQRTRSGYDNLDTVSMNKEYFFDISTRKMSIQLLWDESMPAGDNLATLRIYSNVKVSQDTRININIDGKKYKFNLKDTEKSTTIGSEHKTQWVSGVGQNLHAVDREVTTQTEVTKLYFNLPDTVIREIISSKKTIFMVNFANDQRLEADTRWIKLLLNEFYGEKNKHTVTSKTESAPTLVPTSVQNKTINKSTPKHLNNKEVNKTLDSVTEIKSSQPEANPAPVQMIVANSMAKIRKKPSTKAAIVKNLKKGEQVQVIKRQDEWFQIEVASGDVGWCHKSVLKQMN